MYMQEPLFTGTCETLLDAAAQCLNNPFCDLISKKETHCTFHTAVDRTATCFTDVMPDGDLSKARFTPCNCTLTAGTWVEAGSFYLYVTPGTYKCSDGQMACWTVGGTMAEFNSRDEMNAALTYVTADVFVGGKRVNGRYYWMTTDQEIDRSLWVPGQPELNNSCVQIWHDKEWLGRHILRECGRRSYKETDSLCLSGLNLTYIQTSHIT